MTRKGTLKRRKIIIDAFHRLLRSGKDYSTKSMYVEVAKKAFVSPKTAGNIVRNYYQDKISDEMSLFVAGLVGVKHETKLELFTEKFNVCTRESRLIIRYIIRKS